MTIHQVLDVVDYYIKKNGNEEITGVILNGVLKSLISFTNDKTSGFNGVIGVNDKNDGLTTGYWIAVEPGKYEDFGGVELPVNSFGFIEYRYSDNNFHIKSIEIESIPDGDIFVGQVHKSVNGDRIEKYLMRNAIAGFKHSFADNYGYEKDSLVYADNRFWKSRVNGNKQYPSDNNLNWEEVKFPANADQNYNPNSSNPQSGKAVSQALLNVNIGFGGEITSLDQKPTVNGMYIPKIEGTYPNFGNLTYSRTDGFVMFLVDDGTFTKVIIPINAVESEIKYENNAIGVSGRAVESYAIKKVNNIIDLRAEDGEYDGQTIELLGYYIPNDKPSLKYEWSDFKGVDNGGSVIDTPSGSWRAIFERTPTSKDFGAKCDGVTDDLPFINNLLSVNFKDYEISDNSFINGLLLIDTKTSCSFKFGKLTSGTSEFIRLVDCVDVKIIGGSLKGNSGNNIIGIRIRNSKYTVIKDFKIDNLGNSTVDQIRGVALEGDCSYSEMSNILIEGLEASTTSSGVSVIKSDGVGSKYVTFRDSIVRDVEPKNDGDGFKILQGGLDNYLTVENCTFINCAKRGVKLQGRENYVNNVKVIGNTYFAGIDAQEGFSTITNCKINLIGTYENGISLCDSNNIVENIDIIGSDLITYANSTRAIRLDKSTEFETNLNGTSIVIRDIRIKNSGRPIYIRNVIENPKLNINIENIDIRNCNHLYAISLEKLSISNLRIRDINVYDNFVNLNSILDIPATVSVQNAYIRNSNVRMLSGAVNQLRNVMVDYADWGYINTNIQRIEQFQDLRKITTNWAPTNASIKAYIINSKPGDELINNYQNGDFVNIKGYVCTRGGDGVNDVGTWKTLRFMDRSNSVQDSTNPNATDLETAISLVNEIKEKFNLKLKSDRESGQQM